MITLFCVVVGVAENAFPVVIDENLSVGHLVKAIAEAQKLDFAASKLQLFLAQKDGVWLKSKDLRRMRKENPSRKDEKDCMSEELDDPTDKISAKFLNKLLRGLIHVLVVIPELEHAQTGLRHVTGSVENALNTKDVRCRLYQLMGSYLGPAN